MGKPTEEQRQERVRARARRAALQAEEDARRQKEKREQWKQDGTYLSREEFEAGYPQGSIVLAIGEE
ncbi:hypothetical protein [Streptomyces spiralis]